MVKRAIGELGDAAFAGGNEDEFFGTSFDDMFEPVDPSVEHYPEPYCGIVEGA